MPVSLVKSFREAAHTLSTARDFSPSNKAVEGAVMNMISICISAPEQAEKAFNGMSEIEAGDLRAAFMSADREMEKYWSANIQAAAPLERDLIWDDFQIYPWFADYPALYEFEKKALESVHGPITKDTRIAYIGSGALPIIPLMLHEQTGCQIDCYDLNEGAVALSKTLTARMGFEDGVRIHLSDGAVPAYDGAPDILFLANGPLSDLDALNEIVAALKPETVFARSSSGGTQMLYPSLPENGLNKASYRCTSTASDHEHGTHTALMFKPAGAA